MKNTKIIFLDMDGTLLKSDGTISEKTKFALSEVMKKGIKVCLATGRPRQGVKRYVKELGLDVFDGYAITYNGAEVRNMKTDEIIYNNPLFQEDIIKIYNVLKDYDINPILYKGDKTYAFDEKAYMIERETRVCDCTLQKLNSISDFKTTTNKILVTGYEDYFSKVKDELFTKLGNDYTVSFSTPFYLAITKKGVDKSIAINKLLDNLEISSEDAMAFGDGGNDVTMLRTVNYSIAMGNASDLVKSNAKYVTLSNEEEGIYNIIYNNILN